MIPWRIISCNSPEGRLKFHIDENGFIESVKTNAPIALIEDQTIKGFAIEKSPKFEMYLDKSVEYRFRLKAKNGQIIANGEGYKSKSACQNDIESIKKNSADAAIVEEK
jgi:uncharacterized protein